MKPFLEILRRFLRETEPSPFAVRRVRRRIAPGEPDPVAIRALLHTLPEPSLGAATRVRARLAQPVHTPSRLAPALGIAAVAAAAAVALVFGLRTTEPEPLALALSSDREWIRSEPAPNVSLGFQGTGRITGDEQSPRVVWESGTLDVQVEPDQGVNLVVETREAEVRVVGTAFAVTRDVLGTRVVVDHGRVAVRCLGSGESILSARDDHTCLPTTVGGLLNRAGALHDQGAPATQLLETADAGLALDAPDAMRIEFATERVKALHSLGRDAEALGEAERYLASGVADPGRQSQLRSLAAEMAWNTGGCPTALPHLARLAEEPEPRVAILVQLSDCLADTDGDGARAALERALAIAGPDDQAVLRDRIAVLAR